MTRMRKLQQQLQFSKGFPVSACSLLTGEETADGHAKTGSQTKLLLQKSSCGETSPLDCYSRLQTQVLTWERLSLPVDVKWWASWWAVAAEAQISSGQFLWGSPPSLHHSCRQNLLCNSSFFPLSSATFPNPAAIRQARHFQTQLTAGGYYNNKNKIPTNHF